MVFWTGLPFVLGAAALVLGVEGRKRARAGAGRAGAARAAFVMGAIQTAGWLVLMMWALVTEI